MSVPYASGKYAISLCDVCGQRYPLKELKVQVVAGRPTNIKACPYCLDKDHPQLMLGRFKIQDPQALLNPRPDTGIPGTRELWGWNPVGNPAVYASAQVGVINILIDGVPSPITYSGIN
jgi:hypothetical protein